MHKAIIARYQDDIKALFDIADWKYVEGCPSDYFSICNVIVDGQEISCSFQYETKKRNWKIIALDDTVMVIIERDEFSNIIFKIVKRGETRVKVDCSSSWFIDLDCKVYGKVSVDGYVFIDKVKKHESYKKLEEELMIVPEKFFRDYIAVDVMQYDRVNKIIRYLQQKKK